MRRVLVLQHLDVEHPGIFREFMREEDVSWEAVELDEGETPPPLDGYDALIAMGGPMDVWEEDAHPWLRDEKACIRDAVRDRGLPFLGVCLGHQLLADALGGRVGKAAESEVGVRDVALTADGRADPLFAGFPERFGTLQWHGAEVTEAPAGARVLARSPACGIQAMALGRACSIQFHVEATDTTVDDWAAIPAYRDALHQALGPGAVDAFRETVAENHDRLQSACPPVVGQLATRRALSGRPGRLRPRAAEASEWERRARS